MIQCQVTFPTGRFIASYLVGSSITERFIDCLSSYGLSYYNCTCSSLATFHYRYFSCIIVDVDANKHIYDLLSVFEEKLVHLLEYKYRKNDSQRIHQQAMHQGKLGQLRCCIVIVEYFLSCRVYGADSLIYFTELLSSSNGNDSSKENFENYLELSCSLHLHYSSLIDKYLQCQIVG